MTADQFIATWHDSDLSERSAYQQHFLGLCDLLGQPKPAEVDKDGSWYTFERGVKKDTGGQGFADVWMRGRFGWEYKGKRKDLKAAYQQLCQYREALDNPPLLWCATSTGSRSSSSNRSSLAHPIRAERHLFRFP